MEPGEKKESEFSLAVSGVDHAYMGGGLSMTTREHYERLRRLFIKVCDLEPAERAALLDRECADDPSLRREIETLLAKDASPHPFLKTPMWRGGGSGD